MADGSRRASDNDHEPRIYYDIPYRHIPARAEEPFPERSFSSASSLSSSDRGPSDNIAPDDSASREHPASSHLSARSRRAAAGAGGVGGVGGGGVASGGGVGGGPPAHAPEPVSRAQSHHRPAAAPGPPRPDSLDGGVHFARRLVRERSIERERVRRNAPPYPDRDEHRAPPPQRQHSGSSLGSSESSSFEGHPPTRGYPDPRYLPQGVYAAPLQQHYQPSRPHPYGYYEPDPGGMMHMSRHDPYYRDPRDRYGAFAMSPPPDPFYPPHPSHPPHRHPRPRSYVDAGYHEAMVPAGYPPQHLHHYPPPPHPPPPLLHPQIAYIAPPMPQPQAPPPSNSPPPPAQAPAAPAAPPAPQPPPTPAEDPDFKRLQEELAGIKEAQKKSEEQARAAEREAHLKREAEHAALKKILEEQEADKKRKAEITAAEQAAVEKAQKEAEEKAKQAKDEAEKKAAEEKKKLEDLEKKKKELEEDIKKAKGDPDSKKPAVRMKDSVLERKFDFPWALAKKWNETSKLLEQAFEPYPDLHRRIVEGRYDLVGPDKQFILSSVWETVVQPGWEVTLLMNPELHQQPPPPLQQPMPPPMDPHLVGFADLTIDPGRRRHGHKHRSSKRDKKRPSSKEKDRHKRDKGGGPTIVDPAPMPPGALFGEGLQAPPPPPMDGFPSMPPTALEKDRRGEKKKSSKSSGGVGWFGRRK